MPCGKKSYFCSMDLFSTDEITNRLPYDGTVIYYGKVLNRVQADFYFNRLLTGLEWKNDEARILGKHIVTSRKVAWYGDEKFPYTYSNTTKQALPWTKELLELKNTCETQTGETYNSCLANLYHNNSEGMAWHSDAEKALKKNGAIASFSFGAERSFSFKHKQSGERISFVLEHGSLLVMKDETQTNWMHRLPPTAKLKHERINLTFRTIISS
jgi:alkylated DNA repair dioxygenase AlkB